MQRVLARFRYWEDEPPPAVMLQVLACMWGWKPKDKAAAPEDAMDALRAMFPSGKI